MALLEKEKLWDQYSSWQSAEKVWDEGAQQAAKQNPLRGLKSLPHMPGVTEETAKNMKWKAMKYMVQEDHSKAIRRSFLKHPFRYGWNYLRSLFKKESYRRQGDFFFYGIPDENAFREQLKKENTLLVVGFSYCHKPFECPSGRFSDACIHDAENATCRQCFIGKMMHAAPQTRTKLLAIPTVHYISEKMFEFVHAHPDKQVVFLITACEMTLKMFGDWGNMVKALGIGVRLDGRICNTMRAFELSEKGVKPGLTVVLDETQEKMLHLMQEWRTSAG